MSEAPDGDVPLMTRLLDALDELFFVFTGEGRILYWNRRVNEVTGYSDDEIGSMHPVEFVPEDQRSLVVDKMQEVLERGTTRFETLYSTKDGRTIPYEFTGSLLEHGQRHLICGTGRDISQRREAEEAVHENAEKYRRLFEKSQEGIVISTPEGELLDANPAAQRILGYSKEELLEMQVNDLYVDPEKRQKDRELLRERGFLRNREANIRRKDGQEIVCQLSSTPSHTPTGEIELFQTFFRDITEQKRTQEALEASEEKFRQLFEESRDAIVLTTPEGAITDVNSAAEQLFGYSHDEFTDLHAKELYARPQERTERIIPSILETNSSRVLEAWMRHKDGHEFLASASVTIHHDEDGQPDLIQALVRDITQQRRLEEQLIKIQEEERRRIGQELHDGIASQLTGITMVAEGLTSDLEKGETVSPEEMQEVTELLEDATHQTRMLSRGLNPVQMEQDSLTGALERLVNKTEKQSGISCRVRVEETLSQIDNQTATHLYRIAQEATNNAVKHAEATQIEVELSCNDEELLLEVSDDGKGIPDDQHLSEGLGLHTMRYRSDLIDGSLNIRPSPDGGTCVQCTLTT